MRTFVIGDIHGCLRALDKVLEKVSPATDDWVIGLGDFIDRGDNSPGVLKRLRELSKRTRFTGIMGNHEEMMLISREALKRPGELGMPMYYDWLVNGGYETVRAYGGVRGSLRDVPEEDWVFVMQLAPYVETEGHVFVHAGVRPELPMEEQDDEALRWMRFDMPKPHVSGKVMVCGHTMGKEVRNHGHAICLDTGAFRGGWLTCLETETGAIVQATEQGQVRVSHVSDYRVAGDGKAGNGVSG